MSVIFTDTDCELWHTHIEELGIKLINMPYTVDGTEYMDDCGKTTDFKGFFDKLRDKKQAFTSALNTELYREYFEPYFAAGEEILYIAFSSKMSSTFNYLETVIAELSEQYPSARYVQFDTKSISLGAGIQVYMAAKAWKEGKSIDEVVQYLEWLRDHSYCSFMVDDLGHLKRGGRLSATSAFFGGILDIKPILQISKEGSLEVVAKAKGKKIGLKTLINFVKDNAIDTDKYPVYVLDADDDEMGTFLYEKVKEALGEGADVRRQPIGPVIGTHCGPGTLGVVFIGKDKE